MHDGYDADDKWRMVEDELLETAKTFTQSLRQAEYERLMKNVMNKKDARSHILRPIISTSLPLGRTNKPNACAQKKSLTRLPAQHDCIETSDEEDDAPWMNDDCLADLMTSKAINDREIMGLTDTDLVSGYAFLKKQKKAPSNDTVIQTNCNTNQILDSEDEDDLDRSSINCGIPCTTKQTLQSSGVDSTYQFIHGRATASKQKETCKSTFNESLGQTKDQFVAKTFETQNVEGEGVQNDCIAVAKHALHKGGQTSRKDPRTVSIRGSLQKQDKKKYNPKSITLHEIPTFLV